MRQCQSLIWNFHRRFQPREHSARVRMTNFLETEEVTFPPQAFPYNFSHNSTHSKHTLLCPGRLSPVSRLRVRYWPSALERRRTPGKRLSSCHLIQHRLINSLWTEIDESRQKRMRGPAPLAAMGCAKRRDVRVSLQD